jgi:hypothetical protein
MRDQPLFWQIFTPGSEHTDPDFGHLRFETKTIGRLNAPSGAIVACDALVAPQPTPFSLRLAPGYYPITLAIAHFQSGDQRIAAAMLKVAEGEPSTWQVAVWEGQEPVPVEQDEVPAYGVDSGTGSFLSLEATKVLAAGFDQSRFDRILARMQQTYVNTREWTDFLLDKERSLNAIIFSSGLGDGAYPSYWGLGASGSPLCLITDFGLVSPASKPGGAA